MGNNEVTPLQLSEHQAIVSVL